jgi:hypothetical protein
MKIRIRHATREDFVSAIVLEFENGLQLKQYNDILWCGEKALKEFKEKIKAVVSELEACGIEIIDKDKLDF